jgi:beta-glucosidase
MYFHLNGLPSAQFTQRPVLETRITLGFHSNVASILLACIALLVASAQTVRVLPYQDVSLPVEKRVDDLISRMTLEETISQMSNDSAAIPRLDIPAYNWWNEGLHGVARSGYATLFPPAIGIAATWDTELVGREADVISTKARAKYNEAMRHGIQSI